MTMITVQEENEKMIEVVMKVDDEFWDNITQLTVFKEKKEIVHCKECRFWGTEQDGYCAAIDDPYMLETEADDFCSWGEKR